MDWIDLAQDRDRWWTLVGGIMNLRVPLNVGNFLTNLKPASFSERNMLHEVWSLEFCSFCLTSAYVSLSVAI